MKLLPLLRSLVFEPLWCLKNHSQLLLYWKELERKQYLPVENIEKEQFFKMQDILCYAYKNNKYYRKKFDATNIKPEDIRIPEDVGKLPFLTKKDIQQNYNDIITEGYQKDKLLHFKTGGSTGTALQIFMSQECSDMKNALTRMCDRWTGWNYGEPVGAVWGNISTIQGLKQRLRSILLLPYIYLDTMSINDASVDEFCLQWAKVWPTLLYGHAHSIYLLSKYLREKKDNRIRPKGIITSSMTLLDHEKVYIEDVLKAPVFNRYGCEEVSLIACECEKHNGLHINMLHLYVEFIKPDGSHAGPGEEGEIVVTDLLNKAMPFIRYKIGDVGVPSTNICSCGRGLALMERVSGRTADFMIKADGTKVAGISLIENTLTKFTGIEQMQILQKDLLNFIIRIVPSNDYTDEIDHLIMEFMRKTFNDEIIISVEKVDSILPEENGKYRFSICEIDY